MNEITKLEKTIFTVLMTISLALIFPISGSVSTYAQVTSNTTATTGTTLTLGEPFYVEHYQAVVEKPERPA